MTNLNKQPVSTLVRSLRAWRAARAQERALIRELQAYTTATEIEDLLAVLSRDDSRETDAMRNILLVQRSGMYRAA